MMQSTGSNGKESTLELYWNYYNSHDELLDSSNTSFSLSLSPPHRLLFLAFAFQVTCTTDSGSASSPLIKYNTATGIGKFSLILCPPALWICMGMEMSWYSQGDPKLMYRECIQIFTHTYTYVHTHTHWPHTPRGLNTAPKRARGTCFFFFR